LQNSQQSITGKRLSRPPSVCDKKLVEMVDFAHINRSSVDEGTSTSIGKKNNYRQAERVASSSTVG